MERLTERKYGEIVSAKKEILCSNFCNNCSQGTGNCIYVKEMVEKLAEYEDAEEQGLLIRLPCKVGDKAYIIDNKIRRVYEMEVMIIYPFGALYEDEEKEISRVYNLFLDGNVYYKHCTFYDIGKSVFLTKAEAEQALAKMKGE